MHSDTDFMHGTARIQEQRWAHHTPLKYMYMCVYTYIYVYCCALFFICQTHKIFKMRIVWMAFLRAHVDLSTRAHTYHIAETMCVRVCYCLCTPRKSSNNNNKASKASQSQSLFWFNCICRSYWQIICYNIQ